MKDSLRLFFAWWAGVCFVMLLLGVLIHDARAIVLGWVAVTGSIYMVWSLRPRAKP